MHIFKNEFIYIINCLSLVNLGILISGRGSNMKAILSAVEAGKIKNVKPSVVISNNPNAPGLRVASERFKIPIKVVLSNATKGWDYDQRIVSVLSEHGVTPESGLICLAGFMRIISPEFVRLYKRKIMNIHPGLLIVCWTSCSKTGYRIRCQSSGMYSPFCG